MRVIWRGHSCFQIETENSILLVDPFLRGNPQAPVLPTNVRCNYILCTHAHDDHLGDAIEIAQRNGAKVIAPYELAEYLSSLGLRTENPMQGGSVRCDFGTVKVTPAIHSSSRERASGLGIPLGPPAGFIISSDGKNIYHAGDTALFSDMRLLARPRLDLALLPIGGYFTMDADDAVKALDYLCPTVCAPMHYGTDTKIQTDPREFQRKAAEAGHCVKVLAPGESLTL